MRVKELASRALTWLGKQYLQRKRHSGFDLSKLALLPKDASAALRRDGLDPVARLGRKRAEEPVSKLRLPLDVDVWLVTGHDEAKAVLGNAQAFSSNPSNIAGKVGLPTYDNPGGLGFNDPPLHTRLRKALTPEFTMRRLNRLTPRIENIVTDQLDEMSRLAEHGPVDLVANFAMPVPSLTICELLGVPYEDRADFQKLSTARFDFLEGATGSFDAIDEQMNYLREIVKKQRADPGEDLLGMLIRQHGDAIDDEELTGLADGLLTGGLETTASMLALGTIILLRDRESFRRVHDDDAAVSPFVEELLRYLTVVQVAFPRFAKEEVEVGGKRIANGDIVLCSLSAANRDTAFGEDAETFDRDRKPSSHLAFGFGIHRCIGAELGRMELRTAYPALVRRFPEMRLAVPEQELSYRKFSAVYGVDSLPVHVGPS